VARLDELRVFKTPYEIACLAEANRIAALGHRAVRDAFLAGERRELDLHLLYLGATRQDDAETPYKNIVAVGAASAILHHVHYRRDASAARSLLLDAGATCRGYASDITRTHVALDGTEEATLFAALLEGMERLQRALVEGVRVGRPYETLHDEAHVRLGALLEETGVVRMSAEACAASGVSRMFLPHGLGHSLGLQTHDVGCAKIRPRAENAWLRNTRVIEPGQVFTIEPGLYFIDTFLSELRGGPHGGAVDWRKVEALAPFGGIRIEDDVVVLPDGAVTRSENLTREVL
jgi:Xaa-Pro dipeptidase